MRKHLKDATDGSCESVSFFSLFQYATSWEKFIMFVGLLACTVTGFTQAVNALNFCEIADAMITYGGLNVTTQQDTDDFKRAIIKYAVSDGLVIISYLIFRYAAIVTFNYAACNQVVRMRGLLFRAIMNWDISWYDLNASGELGSRINEDLARIEEGIGEKIPMYCQYIIAFISAVILSFIYGWELSLICILPSPVVFGILFYITSRTANQAKRSFNSYAQAGAVAEEVFGAIRTVHAFDGKEKEIERYKEKIVIAEKVSKRRELLSALFNGLQWTFFCGMNGLAVWYGVRLIVQQRHWEPEAIVYTPKATLVIFYALSTSITHITLSSIFIQTFASAQAAGAKVLHLIKQISKIDPLANRGLIPDSCQGDITFRNVYFQYPSRPDVKILKQFNLTIRKGEVVAIVGHSGCGKSTCIQLLQRFYDPDEGAILLDGIEIKSLNVNWLRGKIGVVGQEPVLFGSTVYENIRYGREDATKEEIEDAAKVANAHDFIIKLPQGYDTQVGERGAQLSGGQKQRIAIARAIVRNPTILLLDEATSALDIKNEAKVQEALERASKGRTTIIVAHRLSTIRNADKIVVMDKGEVIEMGTHNELMLKQNAYYDMVTTQLNIELRDNNNPESPVAVADLDSGNDAEMQEKMQNIEIPKNETAKQPKPATTLQLLKLHPSDWPLLAFGSLAAFLAGCSIPLFSETLGGFIGGLQHSSDELLLQNGIHYAVLWTVIGTFTGLFLFLHSYLLGLAAESLARHVRGILFKAMLDQEIAWFDDKKNGTGMLCAKLSGEAAALHHATGARIGNILMAAGIIIFSALITVRYKWQMLLIAILFMPPIYFTFWAEKKIRHREGLMKIEALGKSTKLVVEVIANIRTVVSLGKQKLFYNKYMELLAPAAQRQKLNMHIRGICFALTSSLTTVVLMPMICCGCYYVIQGELKIENTITIARAWATATVLVSNYMAYTPNVQRGLMAAGNIFSLLRRQPKITDSNELYRSKKMQSKGIVKFDTVEFSYPSNPKAKILQEFNLDVSQGQNIALVGPSGCGKSTCIQLLQRFYDVDSGKVSIDGDNVRSLTLQNLRFGLGIVSQEASLFNRTIAENIAYGDNTRNVFMNEIVDAGKKANIHNFISSLPQGYDTKVGDKGTQLSGGQKQRIAIARALIRNPKILLLDEATSALDIESEKVVQAALDLAKKGRTCITIAHRLATIIDADVIYVMKDGHVVERGSHKELLQMRGIYYGLYKSQSSPNAWK